MLGRPSIGVWYSVSPACETILLQWRTSVNAERCIRSTEYGRGVYSMDYHGVFKCNCIVGIQVCAACVKNL